MGVLESEYLRPEHLEILRTVRQEAIEEMKPNLIGYAESFLFTDNMLKSAIGKSTGKPYETLFDWANNHNSLNKEPVAKGHEYIKRLKSVRPFTPKL